MQIHENILENKKSMKAVRNYAREQQNTSHYFLKRIWEGLAGPQIS